jgi:hypothetical protein
MKLIRVQSMYTMTFMYPMYKDRHMEKFKRVTIDQHAQEVVLDALRCTLSCSGCSPCSP